MRAVVTGGAGFIGRSLVRQLRERGDAVVALVRDAGRAGVLRDLGCEIVEVELASAAADSLRDAMDGADAVFHVAGSYRVGIPATEHATMFQANVGSTRAVLDTGIDAGVARIVYVSTANVYGNTHGRVVDETYRRPQPPEFLSYYDETKYLAHLAAEERIAAGAPIVIALPCMVYGPGDHSQVGAAIRQAMAGRLPVVFAAELGGNLVHVDDLAAGIILVANKGQIGEEYVLGGEIATISEVVRRAAAVAGKRPPLLSAPSWLLRSITPLGGLIGRVAAGAPNLREMVRASNGVTYWATDAKARVELGYAPRDLESGLRALLVAS